MGFFLYIAGLCMLLSAREGGVRFAGFVMAAGSIAQLGVAGLLNDATTLSIAIIGVLVLAVCDWIGMSPPRDASRESRDGGNPRPITTANDPKDS
jgi:hypothetical protein